jgi:integral membrane protein (TIGR01906 family)
MKKWINCIFKVLQGISVALFTIGISVIASLNLRSIYKYSIQKYDLDKIGQLSKEKLMEDYNILLNYLQNPFAKKLKFNNFIMSSNGEFHFYEVKKIFLSIYLIVLIFVLIFIVIYLIKKYNNKKIKLIKSLNYGANTLISIITVLLTSIFIDFSKAFIIFHKIFFNNEYWIFDSKTDPIINVLPEEVFKLYALVVIIFTLIAIIFYKTIYISYNKHSKLN